MTGPLLLERAREMNSSALPFQARQNLVSYAVILPPKISTRKELELKWKTGQQHISVWAIHDLSEVWKTLTKEKIDIPMVFLRVRDALSVAFLLMC